MVDVNDNNNMQSNVNTNTSKSSTASNGGSATSNGVNGVSNTTSAGNAAGGAGNASTHASMSSSSHAGESSFASAVASKPEDVDISSMLGLHDVDDVDSDSKAVVATTDTTGSDLTTTVDDGLTDEQRKANVIRFLDKMDPDVHDKLVRAAEPTLEIFLQDENRINHYGDKVVEKVNDLVDKQLEHVSKKANYPEINKMIRDMTGDFGDSVEEYEKNSSFDLIDEHTSKFKRWLIQRKETMRRKKFDSQAMVDRFNYIESKLNEKNAELAYNIDWGHRLIVANNQAIDNLIRITAAIEATRDLASRRANELEAQLKQIDISDPDWHRIDDERTALAVVIHDLDVKHAEYVTKLFDAHASNAQVRNIIAISQGIRQKSNSIVTSTIPNMKKVIAQITMTMEARGQAEFINNAQNAEKTARAYLNHTATENNKFVMQVSESPVLTPETIMDTARAIEQQNNEFIQAIENGMRERQKVEQSVVDGVQLIDQSVRDRNARVIDALMGEASSSSSNDSASTTKQIQN